MSRRDAKRARDLNSSGEEETRIFERSKRTVRSPPKYNSGIEEEQIEENMDEMKEMIKQMMEMIKVNTEENKSLRQEMRNKEEKWEREKLQLERRIEKLENKLEDQDKKRRKCNIIIKGRIGTQVQSQQMREWFKTSLEVDVEVKSVANINQPGKRDMLLVCLNDYQKKQEIMKNKSKLRGRDIFIENDLTLEERKIAAKLRQIAREEREKGKQVRIGYKKIHVDGKLFTWDNRLENLIQDQTKN